MTNDSGHQSIEMQLLQHLSPEERHSVLNTAAAADVEDLEQFARYSSPLSKSPCWLTFAYVIVLITVGYQSTFVGSTTLKVSC